MENEYESFLKSNGISADSYILIPCYYNQSEDVNRFRSSILDEVSRLFIDELNEISKYEIRKEVSLDINRIFLSDIKVKIFNDDSNNSKVIAKGKGRMFLSYHYKTKLGVIILCFDDAEFELTNLYDNMSRDEIFIEHNDKDYIFNEWILNRYNLIKCGTPRTFTSLSKKPSDEYFKYLLSNEVYKSCITENSMLCSKEVYDALNTNISQFDFSEIFTYYTSYIQIRKDFGERYNERIYLDCLSLFVLELLQIQDASVSRVNKKVLIELSNNRDFSISKIQEINLEFSKTILFWNLNIFVYPATQKITNRVSKSFELENLMQTYTSNKEFLEHVITTHSIINSEKETRVLNAIVLFLTITQVIPIYYQLYEKFTSNNITLTDRRFFSGTIIIVIIIITLNISRKLVRRTNQLNKFNER